MSKVWGLESFIYRYPETEEMALARWHTADPTAQLIPPLQVQSIPNEYLNHYDYLRFSTDGAWYVTEVHEDATTPGVVYFAPYATGVFREVAVLPDRNGRGLINIAYPEGLVVSQQGTRWVYVLTSEGGVVHEQELPVTPAGDGNDLNSQIELRLLCYVPQGEAQGLIGVALGPSTYSEEGISDNGFWEQNLAGVSFTELANPGTLMSWRPELLVVPSSPWELGTRLAALAADLYDEDSVLCAQAMLWRSQALYESRRGSICWEFSYHDSEEQVH